MITLGKKRGWWLIIVSAVILVVAILTVVFWDAVVLYVAPKVVLKTALTQTVESLKNRFREDPIWILLDAAEPEGQYTADVKLDTTYDVLGATSFDMTVSTDLSANQIEAVGTVKTANAVLPLTVYLDSQFMSVASDDLLGGNRYGITYETFGSDIRSIPLLSFLIPEATLQEWETSVSDVQKAMQFDYAVPQIPEVSPEDMQKLMLGILALPCKAEQEELLMQGNPYECRKLTYSADGEAVTGILGQVWNGAEEGNGSVAVSFWLWEKTLIKVDVDAASGDNRLAIALELGTDPAVSPLSLEITQLKNGVQEKTAVMVQTQWIDNWYLQSWNIRTGEEGRAISYHWNSADNRLKLFLDGQDEAIEMKLAETETGIYLETKDLAQLLSGLSKEKGKDSETDIFCAATISKGAEMTTPEYKNLDQWSLKDLMVLLNGLGSLLHLEIR